MKFSTEVTRLTTQIENPTKELTEFIHRFDTAIRKKYSDIKTSLIALNKKFPPILDDYKSSLVENTEYVFDFKET